MDRITVILVCVLVGSVGLILFARAVRAVRADTSDRGNDLTIMILLFLVSALALSVAVVGTLMMISGKSPKGGATLEDGHVSKGSIVIVGADKGGVGKTFVSRLLSSFAADRKIAHRVVDTEVDQPVGREKSLRRFFPEAIVVDANTVAGQMRIFDEVLDDTVTLVDMRAGIASHVLRSVRNAGLLEDSDQGRMKITFVHVLGSSTQSMSEIVDMEVILGKNASHVLVENEANDGQFFRWSDKARAEFLANVNPAAQFQLPHLDSTVAEDVDRKGVSFTAYVDDPNRQNSDWLKRTCRHWLRQVYAQFDVPDLARMMAP